MADYIAPNSQVLDIGAGEMSLIDYLPGGCVYQPVDLCDRGNGTIVCDFNKGEMPPVKEYTHVVCSGVLEYIYDLANFISSLAKYGTYFIMSYSTKGNFPNVIVRRKRGWVNDMTTEDLLRLFDRAGLKLVETQDIYNQQTVFFLTRPDSHGPD